MNNISSIAPDYWEQARHELAQSDETMAALIRSYQDTGLVSRGEPFLTLARSIIGQQISVKAADAVWRRFAETVGPMQPERVLALENETLRACGLSARKVEYVHDLAGHFVSGKIDPARWTAFEDEAIIRELCDVRGIGRWTAEMFLIFNLLRPDVFPLDDLGLQKAIRLQYRSCFSSEEKLTPRQLAAFGDRWRPWRTVATWYLWRSLDPLPVSY